MGHLKRSELRNILDEFSQPLPKLFPVDAPERAEGGGEFGDELRRRQDDDVQRAGEAVDAVNVEGSEGVTMIYA